MPRQGEKFCGDAVLAQASEEFALFALIDGLGHGEGAWRVAQRGLSRLSSLPPSVDALTAITELQAELYGTRGAAATLCTLRERNAELVGIGNVMCRRLGTSCPLCRSPASSGRAASRRRFR